MTKTIKRPLHHWRGPLFLSGGVCRQVARPAIATGGGARPPVAALWLKVLVVPVGEELEIGGHRRPPVTGAFAGH
jgi:hypothetical protein